MRDTQGPEITVPISHLRIQIPSHLIQARFLTFFFKHSFPLYPTNHLNDLHYYPQSTSLFKLALSGMPFAPMSTWRTLPPTPRHNWPLLTHSSKHLFVSLLEYSQLVLFISTQELRAVAACCENQTPDFSRHLCKPTKNICPLKMNQFQVGQKYGLSP